LATKVVRVIYCIRN